MQRALLALGVAVVVWSWLSQRPRRAPAAAAPAWVSDAYRGSEGLLLSAWGGARQTAPDRSGTFFRENVTYPALFYSRPSQESVCGELFAASGVENRTLCSYPFDAYTVLRRNAAGQPDRCGAQAQYGPAVRAASSRCAFPAQEYGAQYDLQPAFRPAPAGGAGNFTPCVFTAPNTSSTDASNCSLVRELTQCSLPGGPGAFRALEDAVNSCRENWLRNPRFVGESAGDCWTTNYFQLPYNEVVFPRPPEVGVVPRSALFIAGRGAGFPAVDSCASFCTYYRHNASRVPETMVWVRNVQFDSAGCYNRYWASRQLNLSRAVVFSEVPFEKVCPR